MSVFAIACIVVGSWTIAAVLIAPPIGRAIARNHANEPDEAQPAEHTPDFPTVPIEAIPPDQRPETPRLMLRPDELLWHKQAEDDEGRITLGLLQAPQGQLGVLMDVDGIAQGVRLDRFEVQELRDALTVHLVQSSRPVTL